MSKPLKDRLQEEMKRRKIKFPQLEKETGIAKDRMYKWYQDGSMPKYEDAQRIEAWLANKPIVKPAEPPAQPDKLDTVIYLVTQILKEAQNGNQKLNGLEQMQIVGAAMQSQYFEWMVSRLDPPGNAVDTVEALQRKAFEKLTGNATKDTNQTASNSHR